LAGGIARKGEFDRLIHSAGIREAEESLTTENTERHGSREARLSCARSNGLLEHQDHQGHEDHEDTGDAIIRRSLGF
jgi:hypothetical protein